MNICLFGSGSKIIDKTYLDEGYKLGKQLALNEHSLIFGGGNYGMMGAVAKGVYDNNGHIIGITPEWMEKFELLYPNCDEIIYTKSMDERKLKFMENSEAFIISPGGIGTLDEFFDIITLKKLLIHDNPLIIFNINNFYDKMLEMLTSMIDEGFIRKEDSQLIVVKNTAEEIISYLNNY